MAAAGSPASSTAIQRMPDLLAESQEQIRPACRSTTDTSVYAYRHPAYMYTSPGRASTS